MRFLKCTDCTDEVQTDDGSPMYLLVRLYAKGWRLVDRKGMKWPLCPSCVVKDEEKKKCAG